MLLLSWMVECIFLHTRCLLHLRRALTASSHLAIWSVAHRAVARIRMSVRHLLRNVGSSMISRRIVLIILVLLVQIRLAVKVRVAVLHARGGRLHLAGGQFLQVCNTRFEPLYALLLATVSARYLLLMNIVIVAVVSCV